MPHKKPMWHENKHGQTLKNPSDSYNSMPHATSCHIFLKRFVRFFLRGGGGYTEKGVDYEDSKF